MSQMTDCCSRDDEVERARKKARRDHDDAAAAQPPAVPAQQRRASDASVVQRILAELIQELQSADADAAKSSKLLSTYQVFLNAFDSDAAPQPGVFQCAIERNSLTMVQYLVESGLSLELPGPHGLPPPLALACALGHIDIAKYLVSRGAHVDSNAPASATTKCVSPLYFAAGCGFLEIVKWLVGVGANLEAADYQGMTPMHAAAASGHFQVMKYLLSAGAEANCKLWSGGNARSVAAEAGQLRILEYLVEHKIGKFDRLGEMTDCLEPAVQNKQVGVVRYILSKGEFTRKQASDCLATAIKRKQMEIFELLVSFEALEGVEEGSRLQLLGSAIEAGLVGAVELLLQDRASFTQEITPNHLTAVHLMAKVGNVPMLQLLERINTENPVDFNIRTDRDGLTPLHIAAFHGQMGAVRYLLCVLPSSYDVNFESTCHNTALNGAAEGGHIEIVKFLLSRGAAIQRYSGTSALYRAASEGHFEIVKYLCEHGATINFLGGGDMSVLQAAVRNRHVEIVEYLLEEWRADPTTLSTDGLTALDHSMTHPAMLRLLLAHGAYRERDLQDTSRALCCAILRGGRVEGIKMLIAHGSDVNAEFVANEEEIPLTFTPLIIATITGQLALVKLLCESGAYVEGRTDVGESALMFAAEKGCLSMVKYLVEEQNADVNCASDFSFAPIEIAKRQDHTSVVQYLLEHGADPPKREMLALETFHDLLYLTYEEETAMRAEDAENIAYWERQGFYDDFFDEYFW